MSRLEKGYIQIYTGNGKGKTTAALGQALRASGSGMKTFIVQFMKDFPYGEIKGIQALGNWVQLEQYGDDGFVIHKRPPSKKDIQFAQLALTQAKNKMFSEKYDIVILDEICVAIYFGLLNINDVISFLKIKPEPVELILTGRYCPQELIKMADLVTEMKEIRHYYSKGIQARKGIES